MLSQRIPSPVIIGTIVLSFGLIFLHTFYRSLYDHDVVPAPLDKIDVGSQLNVPEPSDRTTLVTYAYFETENARQNLIFFVNHGLLPDVDFVFILNGETDAESLIPSTPNVRIVHRPNTCFDLGSHGQVLREDDLWKKYRRFIVLNASIRGPFVPYWSHENWVEIYLSRVTDTVKLVGMTANCLPIPHVQSMIWATDYVGMSVLLDPALAKLDNGPAGLSPCYANHDEAVWGEIGTTSLMRNASFEVDTMIAIYHTFHSNASFAHFTSWCEANPTIGDFLWEGNYQGISVHPYELIFFKANRNISPTVLDRFTNWHNARGSSL